MHKLKWLTSVETRLQILQSNKITNIIAGLMPPTILARSIFLHGCGITMDVESHESGITMDVESHRRGVM